MLLHLKNGGMHNSKVACKKSATLIPDIREDILLS